MITAARLHRWSSNWACNGGGMGSMSISPERLENTHYGMIYRKLLCTPQEKTCQAIFYNILR